MGYDRELIYQRCLYTHPTAENFNEMGCFQAEYRNLSAGWEFYHGEEYLKEICSRAIPYFSQAIKLNPQYTPALLNRAYAYAILGEYKLAIADYNKALDLDPKQHWGAQTTERMMFLSEYMRPVSDSSGRISMPDLMERKIKKISTTEYIQGIPLFSTMLEREKTNKDFQKACGGISFHRAGLYARMGKYKKALELLKEPLKLGHPEKGELLYLMGKCYYALKNYEKAVEAYEDVLKQEYYFTKRGFFVLIRLAKIYYLLGQKDLGKQKLVEFFIRRGVKNPEESLKWIKNNIKDIGDIEFLLSIPRITESDYTDDFEKDPNLYGRFDAYVERGNCYFALKNYKKALEDYKTALSRRLKKKKIMYREIIEIDESINYLKYKIDLCEEAIKELHKNTSSQKNS